MRCDVRYIVTSKKDTLLTSKRFHQTQENAWMFCEQPRELPRVKGGVSLMPEKEVVSWSRNILELVATEDRKEQEDEEPSITETAVRTNVTTGQSGAEEPLRRTEDRWPRGAYS
ncbi:hypothetical protein NDU88_008852 [Pleurodeles waltl]|uniref:Uncharacterized protein n=1 Tax=Pleurodeles waltl TaxID=8319 RepID=A0AAV7NX89_PLEWA|nr:hypothetical protein NDU88_008852 [Pleurodeles waltl]